MKNKLVSLIAWLGYWLGVDALFYRLNRRCKRVLTFHNVFPDELCREDGGGGMSMSVSQFKRMIREVRKCFRISNDLDDVGAVTLTFDDGFCNHYEVAHKVRSIPGKLRKAYSLWRLDVASLLAKKAGSGFCGPLEADEWKRLMLGSELDPDKINAESIGKLTLDLVNELDGGD